MSEKLSKSLTGAGTSVPNKMRLYATWVDRTPSNCIPRLCSLTFTRLTILKPMGSEPQSVSIAVKMHSSKRTLRTNELPLAPNGLLDTPLDVTFCLQYPHFLKREGNKLHILLQRRKRYKNRTMLGFKTLAEGVIRMDQVLQRPMDMELELVNDSGGSGSGSASGSSSYITSSAKDPKSPAATVVSGIPVARLSIAQLSSTPIDHDHKMRVHDFSDDDEEISSGEEEAAELSDSEPIRPKLPRARRHNLKQRFVSLLRRFRVPDTEGGRAADLDNPSDIQALFQELESLSCDEDSAGEQDTMSISSTPKPSLRPFFSSSRSLLDNTSSTLPFVEAEREEKTCSGSDGNADLCYTDPEAQSDPQTTGSPPREQPPPPGGGSGKKPTGDSEFAMIMQELSERKAKLFRSGGSSAKKKNSLSVGSEPAIEQITSRKVFLDLITKQLPLEDNTLPECVVLMTGNSCGGQMDAVAGQLATKLASLQYRVFQPIAAVEAKAVVTALFNKIHKYCNNCAKPGTYVKILLVGGDTLIGWFVRPYVEMLSSKPSEWLTFSRVYIVPLGACNVARQLSQQDQGYQSLFPMDSQPEASVASLPKPDDLIQRIHRYLHAPPSAPLAQLPIGEAMLTCHDENSQLFIPFVSEVRVGPADHSGQSISVDLDDPLSVTAAATASLQQCSSPPSVQTVAPITQTVATSQPPQLTPPSSPNVHAREAPWEPLELQIDYWQQLQMSGLVSFRHHADQPPPSLPGGGKDKDRDKDKEKEGGKQKQEGGGKQSLKALFRGLQAQPLVHQGLSVTMYLASKEKKQKIMRLGKKKEKDKDSEPRCQIVEGVSRLICSARASHNSPIKIYIDGVEFGGVKFFQLSSTWQTHVKSLTVALAGVPLASSELS